MNDTGFSITADQKARLMQGHNFDGKPLPDVPTGPIIVGSGGLYSSVSDILTWLQWHVDRFAKDGAEVRLIEHATWLVRDGLIPVYGFDGTRQDGRNCPCLDRDDAPGQSSSHTPKSRGAWASSVMPHLPRAVASEHSSPSTNSISGRPLLWPQP